MSEPHRKEEQNGQDRDSQAMRELLKRALAADEGAGDSRDLLAGVQRRIRNRSRGKFFGDGWSTTQARASYVFVALITLLLVALAYFALGPITAQPSGPGLP